MRLTGNVVGADSTGDRIILTLNLLEDGAAEWRPYQAGRISLPHNDKVAKAYHIGRRIVVNIDPA